MAMVSLHSTKVWVDYSYLFKVDIIVLATDPEI